ncbi:MAG: hypothetical protein JXB05_33055 [Myxococcaceae bacterium]|nr:hypothetical protein [Myxococcaceae bacterium]
MALSLAAAVRIFERQGSMLWSLLAWGLFMGGPQLVCAALAALTSHPAASWVGLGWYSFFLLTVSLLDAGGLMLFIVLLCSALALFSLVRSVQLFLHRRRSPA